MISTIVLGWPSAFGCGLELLPGGIDVSRVNEGINRISRRRFGRQRAVGGFDDLAIDFRFERFEFALFQHAFTHEKQTEFRDRIAMGFRFPLLWSFVEFFVVRERVGIGPRDVRVNQSGPAARTAMVDGAFQDGVAFERFRAVTFLDMQIREICDEFRDAASGSLRFDGNRNRVAIVFDEKENRHAAQRGGIDGFVEFALAGGSFSSGDVGHFVAMEADRIAQRSAARLFKGLREFFVVQGSFRGTDCVQPSRPRG